ncbi:hypothetical protein FA95DRAFT_1487706 [Auriscalpium vulgare]|uniref:Uncharacterized protein n=1 Tax=Auriscalpium vulgare TaxID=40419 RepID=A0ACB8S159_9AGAM|nr:hypothetical protein FA95DRAFT_1487706 [Auriscalpium vulgare]
MSSANEYNDKTALSYLGLPPDHSPSPATEPLVFLSQHLRQLPPHLLLYFSSVTTPRQRSSLALVRNRRYKYTASSPSELGFSEAKHEWPMLWEGRERRGLDEGQEEKEWAERNFLDGGKKQAVGKLGALLAEMEEEREADRVRMIRRAAAQDDFVPEEDEESSDEEMEEEIPPEEPESAEEAQAMFLRRVRERFIYGLLPTDIYDKVDWDDSWDEDDRDAEDRWFDEDDDE